MMMLYSEPPPGILRGYSQNLRGDSCGKVLRVKIVGKIFRSIAEELYKVP
jgi:hypothetical protein